MKLSIITTLGLLAIQSYSFSQSTIKRLKGDWIVSKVIDTRNNKESRGKFADSESYLKFRFTKRKLVVLTSPIENGLSLSFIINKNNEIELVLSDILPSNPSETIYKIITLTESELVLSTYNSEDIPIQYFLTKIQENSKSQTKITVDPIVIKRILYEGTRDNFVYFTHFKKGAYDFNTPIYKSGRTIGTDLCVATKFAKNFPLGVISEPLTVSIKINSKGRVIEVKKIKVLNSSIDKSTIEFLKKSKWIPLYINGNAVNSELIFQFYFLMEKGSLY